MLVKIGIKLLSPLSLKQIGLERGSTPQKGKLWKSLQSLLNSKRSFYVLKNIEIYHLQIWRLLFNICCGSQDTKARQLFEFSIRRDWTDLVHLKEYEICNRYLIDISIHLWAGVMKVQILSRRGQLHKKNSWDFSDHSRTCRKFILLFYLCVLSWPKSMNPT